MGKPPNRLKEWRERRKLSQPAAAKLIGCSVSQLKKLERGERGEDGLGKWLQPAANAYRVTPNDLLIPDKLSVRHPPSTPDGEPVEIAEYDIRGGMGEGEMMAVESPTTQWSVPHGFFGRGDLIIADSKGDSMKPTIVASDRVVIDRSDQDPSQGGVFAIWDGHGLKFKRIETIAQSTPLKIRVLSDNPIYPPDELVVEESTIVGRVIGLIRRFL